MFSGSVGMRRRKSSFLFNIRVAASCVYAASIDLYLGIADGNNTARRMLSCSFGPRCSFSFIERAEDDVSMMRREAPEFLILYSSSKRVYEPVERASVF